MNGLAPAATRLESNDHSLRPARSAVEGPGVIFTASALSAEASSRQSWLSACDRQRFWRRQPGTGFQQDDGARAFFLVGCACPATDFSKATAHVCSFESVVPVQVFCLCLWVSIFAPFLSSLVLSCCFPSCSVLLSLSACVCVTLCVVIFLRSSLPTRC